jgi:hypothetical protein
MGLFDSYHLSLQETERRLMRPVKGDPSEGEMAVLSALNADRVPDARRRLKDGAGLGPDFTEMVEEHLRQAFAGGAGTMVASVRLPASAMERFRDQAFRTGRNISEVLEDIILAEAERRDEVENPLRAVHEAMGSCTRAVGTLLSDVTDLTKRVGSIQELGMRLGRIEKILATTPAR